MVLIEKRGKFMLEQVNKVEPDWERLIERVEADDVRVDGERVGSNVPIINEPVLNAAMVEVKSAQNRKRVPVDAVQAEHLFLAVLDEGITILVVAISHLLNGLANAEQVVDGLHEPVEGRLEAVNVLFSQKFLRPEVRHAFAARRSRNYILVRVDERVDAMLTHAVD